MDGTNRVNGRMDQRLMQDQMSSQEFLERGADACGPVVVTGRNESNSVEGRQD
jgi:hypothetical protein